MRKKALVTGGAGFIGSNLTLRLLRDGWVVHVFDNLSTGNIQNVNDIESKGAKFYKCNYGSGYSADIVKNVRPDVVFHLGAIPRVQYSVEYPIDTHENNVLSTLKLMEVCKQHAGKFVFSSSSSVNGDTNILPTPETVTRNPKSPYALQKAVVEDYCRLWSQLYNLDTVSLRYFNVFGPRQYGDSAYSTVISAWCHNYKVGKSFRLDGTGEQYRDFCFVDNVVDANILAAEHSQRLNGDVFNIAGGQVKSVNDILMNFKERFKTNIPEITYAPPRIGDIFATEADLTKSKNVLGYVPKISFNEGLEETFKWWQI
jgi:UDP-glucose 4-epimerase